MSEESEPATDDPTALAELLSLTDGQRRGRCLWSKGVLPAGEKEALGSAAWLIAEATMRHRCEGAGHVFDLWRAAAKGEHDLSEREAESIEPFVRTAFGLPDQPRPEDHVQGYVAEMTWFLIASEVLREDRTLVYIKGPDFHVTGPGGDGLVVYDIDDALAFRLWEIKKHTGSSRVAKTISRAYGQLGEKATQYLAELTALGPFRDERLQPFLARLVDMWIDAEAAAGAGVAVSTSEASMPSTAFGTMGNKFPALSEPGQLEGLMVALGVFPVFAHRVKENVWKGL